MSSRAVVWPAIRTAFIAIPAVPRRTWRLGLTRWRQSLQLRVVTTTMLVSGTVAVLLGFFLMQELTQGVLLAKEKAARSEARAGLSVAKNVYQTNAGKDPNVILDKLAKKLAPRSVSEGRYEVVILNPSGGVRPGVDLGRVTNAISPDSVPPRLRQRISEAPNYTQYNTNARLQYTDGTTAPGFVIGVALGPYQLYHLFPLTEEQETLALVQRRLAAVGAGLVLLLAAIAWLVTRQVVTPVRLAARAAETLADGRLEERMRVRGEDDLARLATSFNQMAKNLQEKISELEELSQVQRQFVSDVSHELRTPLTTVRIAADVLYENRDDFGPEVSRSAELLQNQLERFEALLTDLLEISRYDAGAATLDAESVDARDLVLRAVGDTEQLAEQHRTKVVLRLPSAPCLAEVDRRRVERILRNLIVNAIEHGEQRDVVVTAAADRYAIAIAVRDHGVGLRPGEATQVFERFWRADPARTRHMGGTGLGLSIAKEDAQLHGGWLQAWGEPGKGCQFRLSLPRSAEGRLRGSPLPLVPPEIELARGRLTYSPRDRTEGTLPASVSGPETRSSAPGGYEDGFGPEADHDTGGRVEEATSRDEAPQSSSAPRAGTGGRGAR